MEKDTISIGKRSDLRNFTKALERKLEKIFSKAQWFKVIESSERSKKKKKKKSKKKTGATEQREENRKLLVKDSFDLHYSDLMIDIL